MSSDEAGWLWFVCLPPAWCDDGAKMKFNKAEIAVLARQPSNNFDKEGVLFVRERSEGLFGKNKNEGKKNVCL